MAKKKSQLQKKIDDPFSRLWRNKADKTWKELVFLLGGSKCAICGSVEYIQAHHIIPRNILLSRHNAMNGILLCPSHHKYSFVFSAHKNPVRFILWLQEHQPERWAWLSKNFDPNLELSTEKPNYKGVYTFLLEEVSKITPNLIIEDKPKPEEG